MTLEQFKAFASATNMLSMFEVEWKFKEGTPRTISSEEIDELSKLVESELYGKFNREPTRTEHETLLAEKAQEVKGKPYPWYPLFYRCNGTGFRVKGTILYPEQGRGRYFRDELLQAIAWCETFPEAVIQFDFKGAMEFFPVLKNPNDPTSYERPFAFVQELFDTRSRIVAETKALGKVWTANAEAKCGPCPADKAGAADWIDRAETLRGTKPYNILEKALKLILNSLYGKTAQSIGSEGELAKATNPFYAGAITAGTRARLIQAGLHGPHQVIFFATDGIMSIGPLEGLETVETKVLGEWEFAEKLDVR
jgi:hypothetical protein